HKANHKKSYGKKGEKKEYKEYESYERYEKYERYERYEKQAKTINEFDPVTATEFEKSKYYGKMLGLSGKVTPSHIRKVYLNLIAQYHPDKVASLGVELVNLAEKKTKEINSAYEWLKKKHNF
ncbi:MAG: DnaJ domain-containing protein, partial [Bacteroidota bacterium]|nr:DnaJ domain-containing protein [Bacteroidota bacterium]